MYFFFLGPLAYAVHRMNFLKGWTKLITKEVQFMLPVPFPSETGKCLEKKKKEIQFEGCPGEEHSTLGYVTEETTKYMGWLFIKCTAHQCRNKLCGGKQHVIYWNTDIIAAYACSKGSIKIAQASSELVFLNWSTWLCGSASWSKNRNLLAFEGWNNIPWVVTSILAWFLRLQFA